MPTPIGAGGNFGTNLSTPSSADPFGFSPALDGAKSVSGTDSQPGVATQAMGAQTTPNTSQEPPRTSISMRHGYKMPAQRQTGSPQAAASNLDQTAQGTNKYKGYCAQWVINALNGAGYPVQMEDARNAGPSLLLTNFDKVASEKLTQGDDRDTLPDGFSPQVGDVAVMTTTAGHHQHIAMYDGKQWVSDTRQTNMLPYNKFGTASISFYRPPPTTN